MPGDDPLPTRRAAPTLPHSIDWTRNMHIEPGLASPEQTPLAYATATAAGGVTVKLAWDAIRERSLASFAARSAMTTAAVFAFFEVFPHYPVGVSEVHLILGSTLLLIFGAAPAAIGLALGLLMQ